VLVKQCPLNRGVLSGYHIYFSAAYNTGYVCYHLITTSLITTAAAAAAAAEVALDVKAITLINRDNLFVKH